MVKPTLVWKQPRWQDIPNLIDEVFWQINGWKLILWNNSYSVTWHNQWIHYCQEQKQHIGLPMICMYYFEISM